ncbi:MAG: hypothetical protein ACREA2_11725 [Blastocatellia bacterium]
MAWSYSPTDLEIALNWVRLRIGDTDTNDQQLSDEEVQSLIAMHAPSREQAAAAAADMIAAKFTRIAAQDEADVFHKLAEQIRVEAKPQYL